MFYSADIRFNLLNTLIWSNASLKLNLDFRHLLIKKQVYGIRIAGIYKKKLIFNKNFRACVCVCVLCLLTNYENVKQIITQKNNNTSIYIYI